jgi:biopolymer transport protein ExbD
MRKRGFFNSRLRPEEDNADAINLTPLIDMVFILLIFFLVTASFIRESSVTVRRPQAATALPQPGAELIVTITADEQIWLNDAVVDIRRLRARIEELKLTSSKRSAIILADQQTSTGLLVKTMDQLRLAGFADISVAASSAGEAL